jgi:chemotaxis protein methyltransferase CheR
MNEVEIDIQDVRHLIGVVKEKYKFDFGEYALSSFKRRIVRVLELHKFDSVAKLIERLSKDHSFFDVFLKEITVNTTEMFRDPSFWKALKENVFPLVADFQTIRIWHAACSTGEEVFSMAIALKEAGLYDKSRIFASDINEDVIAKALSGKYPARNMELNSLNYKKFEGNDNLVNYYKTAGDNVIMDLDLLKNVTFKKFDLVQGEQYLKFDIIICRNVLIYFNFPLQDKIIDKFSSNLLEGGFLAVGAKETIAFCKSADKYKVFSHEDKIYKK